MKSQYSGPSPRSFVAEKLQKLLWFALATSSVSVFMALPLFASASIFAFPALLQGLIKQSSAMGSSYNSQTVPLLAAARNIDPSPSVGGGDIAMVGGVALLAEEGPSGTAADIENALPEATSISVYTVHKGDTLGGIARMFGVSVNTIVWANNLKGAIHEGDTLVILPITGVRYTVQKGDTTASIAKKYKPDSGEIEQYNDLPQGAALTGGSTIIIPDGEVATPVVAKPSTSRSSGKVNIYRGGAGPDLGDFYSWPVAGGILTQGLHGYNGVDIGAPSGTNVLAAAAGTVIIARGGGAWNGGYGNYIVIQHQNGTQTLYGHLRSVLTSVGAQVDTGTIIGRVGMTGKATGPHLHFEVRGAVNPFGALLPGGNGNE